MCASRVVKRLALVVGMVFGLVVVSTPTFAQVPDTVCLLCHDDVVPEEEEGQELLRAHKGVSCVGCHVDLRDSDVMEEMEHNEDQPPVDCTTCHGGQAEKLLGSTHFTHFEGDRRPYPDCRSCHTVEHYPVAFEAKDPWQRRHDSIQACSTCHEKDLTHYHESAHSLRHEEGDATAPACVDCHSAHDILNPENPDSTVHEANVSERCESCHDSFRSSLHRAPGAPESSISCSFCHLGHTTDRVSLEARISGTGGANRCFVCHSGQHTSPEMAHHQLAIGEDGRAPETACTECHVFHWKVRGEQGEPTQPVSDCATCHQEQSTAYEASAHGRSRSAGNVEPPTCKTCHGAKDVLAPDIQFTSEGIVDACSSCHADTELMISFDVNPHVVEGFEDTYHGKLYDLLNTDKKFAICTDCHGYHNVLEPEDPDSKVSREHIVETCRECHEDANENFISYLVHPIQPTEEEREQAAEQAGSHAQKQPRNGNGNGRSGNGVSNGGLYGTLFTWCTRFMKLLFLGVMSFFILHTILWAQRGLRERNPTKATRYFRRFNGYERMLHVMVNISFLVLAFTGLPQTFAHTGMGAWILENIMSIGTAQTLHYWAAGVTGLYFVLHLAQIFWVMREWGWRRIVMGPNSLVPQKKDLDDFIQHVRWFLGKAEKPRFDRWTYWEKFDYFAVFWGVAIIGTSGLIRWNEQFFGNLFGGGMVSIATAVHEEEALLATAFIFIVHFFNTHLRSEKFPMDISIYTGVIPEHELHEERPAQLERLIANGRLKVYERKARPAWMVVMSTLWGITALVVGLFLLALIFIGFASHGL